MLKAIARWILQSETDELLRQRNALAQEIEQLKKSPSDRDFDSDDPIEIEIRRNMSLR
jgi:hypothetical protein